MSWRAGSLSADIDKRPSHRLLASPPFDLVTSRQDAVWAAKNSRFGQQDQCCAVCRFCWSSLRRTNAGSGAEHLERHSGGQEERWAVEGESQTQQYRTEQLKVEMLLQSILHGSEKAKAEAPSVPGLDGDGSGGSGHGSHSGQHSQVRCHCSTSEYPG